MTAPIPTPTPVPVTIPALPLPLRYALSLIAGVLSVLTQTTFFDSGNAWGSVVTGVLVFLSSLGILPVVGTAFQSLLARLFPGSWLVTVHSLITAGIAAGTVALTRTDWSVTAHAIIAGVFTVLVALGFGPPAVSIVNKARMAKKGRL